MLRQMDKIKLLNQSKISSEHRRLSKKIWRMTPAGKDSDRKSINKYRNTINGKQYREKEVAQRRIKSENACCDFSEFEPI